VLETHAISQFLARSETNAVLATLVDAQGSSYRRPGARLLLAPNGVRIGSVSGGCLEEDIVARAARVASTGLPDLVIYDTSSENDLVWGVGLGCHGVVRVLIELIEPAAAWAQAVARNTDRRVATELEIIWEDSSANSPRLGTRLAGEVSRSSSARIFRESIQPPTAVYVYGAGDDAKPLVRILKELGWRVCVADPRPAFATAERFPAADQIVVSPAAKLVEITNPPEDALTVVMTHHYVHDLPTLDALLQRPIRYIGLLGPKKRGERLVSDLIRQGRSFDSEALTRLHSPVGLDLGADTPEEVALSIVAEMRATLAERHGGPLRERTQPIHA
jgi:xanthine/CO dehydrogenase XdhC/CoxF family maturation factor